jgi:hypothetical protein
MMRREFETGVGGVQLGRASFPSAKPTPAGARPFPRAPELPRSRLLTVYTISLGLWGTGAVWLLLHYFFKQEGSFGPNPHPLEFWSIAAHGAFGFASLWLIGLMWSVHIPAGWRSLRRRWSGSLMFGAAAFLILSGYLLYYFGDADLRPVLSALHWAVGLACPALFLLHRVARDPAR